MIAIGASFTKVAEGPSQLDADQFPHMLLNKKFKTETKELREKIVILAKTRASTIVAPKIY